MNKVDFDAAARKLRQDTLSIDGMIHADDKHRVLKQARGESTKDDDMTNFQIGDNYYESKSNKRNGLSSLLKIGLIVGGMLASGGIGASIPLIYSLLTEATEQVEDTDTDTQYTIGIE